MEPRKRKRGRRRERVEGNAFMDTVRAAFIRWLALEKWREVEDFRETLGLDLGQAVNEAAQFPSRGRYYHLWVSRWKLEVCPDAATKDSGSMFATIERAVTTAVLEEEAERKLRGDRPLEEDPEYKAFVDRNLESLLRQGDLGVKE
ncbi:MAG: hypothetical protein ACREQO_18770 [Candidatus Binatia bacterium]